MSVLDEFIEKIYRNLGNKELGQKFTGFKDAIIGDINNIAETAKSLINLASGKDSRQYAMFQTYIQGIMTAIKHGYSKLPLELVKELERYTKREKK